MLRKQTPQDAGLSFNSGNKCRRNAFSCFLDVLCMWGHFQAPRMNVNVIVFTIPFPVQFLMALNVTDRPVCFNEMSECPLPSEILRTQE